MGSGAFVVGFSLDRDVTAATRLSAPRFIVDARVGVYGFKIVSGQVMVEGTEKLIAWNPPTEDPASNFTAAGSE